MHQVPTKKKRVLVWSLALVALLLILSAIGYAKLFGPTDQSAPVETFYVEENESREDIASRLTDSGYIRSAWIFDFAYVKAAYGNTILPGGYEISKSTDAWTIVRTLLEPPYFAWIKIPVGVRKEQIAELLASRLGWSEEKRSEFLRATESNGKNYLEGVYYPDVYFIPRSMPPALVEAKIRARFTEVFEPYSKQAVAKGMSWPSVLTIASLIQREAGSASDMYIISGVIQNRLRVGMPLAIDATLQYIGGSEENGWWSPPKKASSYGASPFNTYKNKGLPPHPIANSSLTAIDATLNPTKTNCLFYIHDNQGRMHCSQSFRDHQAYIARYLK